MVQGLSLLALPAYYAPGKIISGTEKLIFLTFTGERTSENYLILLKFPGLRAFSS